MCVCVRDGDVRGMEDPLFSRCRISIILPVWSTYELLHVFHCNLYIPLEFIVLSGILSYNWLSIMLQL